MADAFTKHISTLNDKDIKYLHFDFHHECSKMRWHRVALILDHFQSELHAQGYVFHFDLLFMHDDGHCLALSSHTFNMFNFWSNRSFKAVFGKDGVEKVVLKQTSVVRTNCMDCLDRTNVVQSVVSRWVLNRQLRDIGILGADEKFELFDDFEFEFRNGKQS